MKHTMKITIFFPILVTVFVLFSACASMSPFSGDNPSRYSTEQQTKVVDLLTQAEALSYTCLDQTIDIARVELTTAPEQELWHISSCTGREHSYRINLSANGKIGLHDLRTRRDIHF